MTWSGAGHPKRRRLREVQAQDLHKTQLESLIVKKAAQTTRLAATPVRPTRPEARASPSRSRSMPRLAAPRTVIAIVLLWTEIRAGVGSNLVCEIWGLGGRTMPEKLREYLPEFSLQGKRDALFGSMTAVTKHAMDDSMRVGVFGGASSSSYSMLGRANPI